MKLMKGLLVAASVIALAACGSSDSTTDGGGGTTATPSATSAKTLTAMTNAGMWMFGSAGSVMTALGGTGASVKETYDGANIECIGTPADFECVIWDSMGSATSADHKCTVNGNYSESTLFFSLAYDCYTYNPDPSVSVAGNWTVELTMNPSMTAMTADTAKGVQKVDAAGDCNVEEIADACGATVSVGEGSCSIECGATASCSESTALMVMNWTVGDRGVNVTDDCGSYSMAAGTTSGIMLCSGSSTAFSISFDINGTINDDDITETVNIDCAGIGL